MNCRWEGPSQRVEFCGVGHGAGRLRHIGTGIWSSARWVAKDGGSHKRYSGEPWPGGSRGHGGESRGSMLGRWPLKTNVRATRWFSECRSRAWPFADIALRV